MGFLIRQNISGAKLARHASQNLLLRTPITLTLNPDDKWVLQMGDPRSIGADEYLHGGFSGGGTNWTTVQNVGFQLINEIINGTPPWRNANGPHDPEFVWYQGAYSTSKPYVSTSMVTCEAYAQFAGYHFTLPSNLSSAVTSIQVQFLNMGCCWAYGPAINKNAANKNLAQADYGWSSPWIQQFHFGFEQTCKYHPMTINNQWPYIEKDIMTGIGGQGDFRGERDLWVLGGGAGSVDGRIPTLTNPVTMTVPVTDAIRDQIKQKGHCWVVPTFHPYYNSSTDYGPNCGEQGDGNNNYWACVSLRLVQLQVTIDPQ